MTQNKNIAGSFNFQDATPASPANGDFWLGSGSVYIRSNGATKNVDDIGSGGGGTYDHDKIGGSGGGAIKLIVTGTASLFTLFVKCLPLKSNSLVILILKWCTRYFIFSSPIYSCDTRYNLCIELVCFLSKTPTVTMRVH